MLGAEVIGVIGSIIAIIDGTKKVFHALKYASGLPEAVCEVSERLPTIQTILQIVMTHIENEGANDEACQIVAACKRRADQLQVALQSISIEGEYTKALKSVFKSDKVVVLMKEILEDVQLLANMYTISDIARTPRGQLATAIDDLSTNLSSFSMTSKLSSSTN